MWLDESFGLKRELSAFFRISTTRGIFSLDEDPITRETDELLRLQGFILALKRSLHEKTGNIYISVDNQGYPVLKPQNPLPRGCGLHLSLIARVVSVCGEPHSGASTRTK